MKQCKKCKLDKQFKEFWKASNTKDGFQHICIDCQKSRWKERVTKNENTVAKYNERQKQFYEKNIARFLLVTARKRAKEKGLDCTIGVDDITVPTHCPILLTPLAKHRDTLGRNSYTLDRKDSSKGYIPGNVGVISWAANNLKSNFSIEEIERLLKYMRGELT